MGTLANITTRMKEAAESRTGQRLLKVLRVAFVLGVVAWLLYRLSDIGWMEVWEARPRTAWFYLIWAVLYVQLPIIEAFIYRVLWKVRWGDLFPVILRKRVLNQDVVSYSGEAYLYLWARRNVALPHRRILGMLKDNAIASSLGTTLAAVLLLGVFLYTGQLVLADLIGDQNPLYVTAGIVFAAVLVAVGLRFRKTIFTLPPRTVLWLFAVHLGRFLFVVYVLQIVQWWVVLPTAPLSVWASMLAVMTITNRLPLIPAKDLVGVGAILGMTAVLDASAAIIGSMLLVRIALDKVMNLLLFAGVSMLERQRTAMNTVLESPPEVKEEIVSPGS